MILLEQLYRLQNRDVQARLLDPQIGSISQTLLQASITQTVGVPAAHALLLTHALLYCNPGAGQSVTLMSINLRHPDTQQFCRLKIDVTQFALDFEPSIFWQGELVVPAPWVVEYVSNFNAAVAANYAEGSFGGMLIPLGNIERA